ncbi:type II toxin-antitoxin system Phd/YefM family antitoxin [Chromohalobacter nigrandesensis]|uniref:type II toxin-antitoxin system Phd/YefM family antitoxin n=1 Tax=Chromohalobacter nigrandesensis TaxID=119863 RepID=UPI001FF67A29|nr:type II toxin-antitoxin system Phd/YefM family antitoxin [Chromohalobacter nigrandesensis]MCK0745505.1 type II toxin-antitoxin system Phd/YefM family antitoxin [Chromohalobacter nigrandesensis]
MNTEEVPKSQFKARALEFFRQVEASGDAVIVTDKGRPTIEVRRYKADKRSPLERLRGSVIELTDPFEPVGEDDWETLR